MKDFIRKTPSICVLIFSAVVLIGCTTANRVTMARPEDVKGYKPMGSIKSTVPLGGLFRHMTYQAALNNCLQKAEAMGATHFVPDEDSGPSFLSLTETAHGTAYMRPNGN